MTHLSDLVEALGGEVVCGSAETAVTGIQLDSRKIASGNLFVALAGEQVDGLSFVSDAVRRGAVAVLLSPGQRAQLQHSQLAGQVAVWEHPDVQRTCGLAASLMNGEPGASGELQIAGITGTNGKTTTAHILGHILRCADLAPGVLGTTGHRLSGGRSMESTHTTPDAPTLQALLAEHIKLGGRTLAMEVSSHALMQQRVAGVHFDVAVFTNLSREHLDYHGTMGDYLAAKARLFENLRPGSAAVINADDPAGEAIARTARQAGARVFKFSMQQAADCTASGIGTGPAGSYFKLDGMGLSTKDLRFPLAGEYNVQNALAAAAAARLLGASPSSVLEGLETTPAPAGRLEPIYTGDRGFGLYVDYAHSPDALERALGTLRVGLDAARGDGRLIVVFGCGGDRDSGKRPLMGSVAGRLSDLCIVTSDNPRSEEPSTIVDQIVPGIRGERGRDYLIELDREAAIHKAVKAARKGDVVLIAGKGHETYQNIQSEVLPFDDRVVAQEALA